MYQHQIDTKSCNTEPPLTLATSPPATAPPPPLLQLPTLLFPLLLMLLHCVGLLLLLSLGVRLLLLFSSCCCSCSFSHWCWYFYPLLYSVPQLLVLLLFLLKQYPASSGTFPLTGPASKPRPKGFNSKAWP
jgi:hypothetical protein